MLDRIANALTAITARFGRHECGNVSIMFAVIMPVIFAGVGAAIDYGRAATVRTQMQAAVDTTALMISREATGLTPAQITTKAQAYFNALFTNQEVTGTTLAVAYTANAGTGATVKIDASTTFLSEILKVQVPMAASSTTKWGNIRYRVALALDNTGSMASAGKMTELKSAAKTLINDFYDMAAGSADVYISIVPFAQDVNVGTDNKDATWIKWTDWDSENTNMVCTKPEYTKKKTCEDNGGSWVSETAPHSSWNGCVKDRDQDYDVTSEPPVSYAPATMIPAQQIDGCPASMMGMTSVKTWKQTLIAKIDEMTPAGYTNQSIGLFWAWLTHSTTGPFPTPAKESNYLYQDVIILLTDGLNTRNRWYIDQASIDARQAMLCTNARTQGIKIFAIQVATDGDAISDVTKNCTSQPNHPNYFSYITQASQMTVKFQNIFKELARLRVAA